MATDYIELDPGSGGSSVAGDDDGTGLWQYVKVAFGADGTQTIVSSSDPLPVTGTVDLGATDNAVLDSIAALLTTIDADTGNMATSLAVIDGMVFGAGTEAAAQRVTIATDSTGVLSVDDNGGALTVDNAGTFAVQADTELTTGDLDTGAGTDTRAVVGLVGSASGGGALIPGSATDGLLVNLGSNNDVTVTGTVDLGATDNAVLDAIAASLAIVDNVVFGAGTEAAAQRVTIATDSTGVLSVDDNGSSLTVDYATTGSGTATGALRVELPTNGTGVLATLGTLTTLTGGGVAHDSGDSGNPIKVGGRAISANPTAMTANDRTDSFHDLIGYHLVRPYALNQTLWQDSVSITDTTAVELKAAGAANVRNYITSLLVTNADATVGSVIQITDGNGGTVMWEGYAAAAGGGFSCSFPTPLRGSAATAVYVDAATTSTETLVSACGFQAID